MKKPVEVEILGQRLTVASDDGETHALDVAGFVNDRAKELWGQFPRASLVQIALLTALNIASDYWRLDRDRMSSESVIEDLAKRLEAELGER